MTSIESGYGEVPVPFRGCVCFGWSASFDSGSAMHHSSLAEIESAIPHRPPFLLLDEIVSRDENSITCRKTFRSDEYFFAGHYPNYPLVPGVLLCETALQAGAVMLAGELESRDNRVPMVTRMNDVRFKRPVRPGEID